MSVDDVTPPGPVRAYLDCNILLHFRSLDGIPWEEILGGGDSVVVITISLWTELDKKKYDTSAGVKERARDRERWLKDRKKSGNFALARGGHLYFSTSRHGLDMAGEGLNSGHADDNMLAEVIASMSSDPGSRHVLVTDDGALQILAEGCGLEVIGLPDEFRQDIEDSQTKELRRAKQELDRLQHRLPKLVFEFEGGGSTLAFRLPPPAALAESGIQERLAKARDAYKPMEIITYPADVFIASIPTWETMHPRVSNAQILKHNEQLESYFSALEKYLRDARSNYPRSIPLPIRLSNYGSAPAERLRISLSFDEGVFVSTMDVGPAPEPLPPKEPSPADLFKPQPLDFPRLDMFSRVPSFDSGPDFDDERRRVSYQRTRLDHLLQFSLDLFASSLHEELRSFRIDCEVISSTIPEKVTHALNVHVLEHNEGGD